MPVTLRINVQETAPLDGSTPLPTNARSRIVQNKALGITELTLTTGEFFGEFDPGELLLGVPGSYLLRHVDVVSTGSPVHADGSFIGVRSPDRPGGGAQLRAILDLGPTAVPVFRGSGIVTEGLRIPVPVAHKLVFDTVPDGVGGPPGPHIIQLAFEAANLEQLPEVPGAGLGTFPNPLPPAGLDPNAVSPSGIDFGSSPDPRPITIDGSFSTSPADTVRFIRTSGGPPADLPFTPTGITATTISGTVPTGSLKGTFKVRVSRGGRPSIYNEQFDALVIS